MQNLSVIVTVIVAAVAIIAVLFWRLKATPAVDIEPLNKRIQEEIQKAEGIQAKLEACDVLLRTAEANCAAAKASETAANLRANTADSKTNQQKSEFDALQKQWNDAEPKIATAVEQKKAAEEARAESVERLLALTAQHTELNAKATSLLERATNSEKDASASAAEAKATRERVEKSDARLTESIANLAAASAEISKHKSLLAEAVAQRISAEDAKNKSEQRASILSTKHDTLLGEHKTALERAATANADVENARAHMTDMASTIEALQSSLTTERKNLAAALAKQQSDEDAANKLENLSHAVLEKTMTETEQRLEKIVKSLQKSSGDELEKHAGKVALTLEPLQAKLLAYDESIKRMAKDSQESHGSLTQQITELQKAERSLHDQAQALTYALSASPKVKGMYGELMLKQLVEFVGMQEKCHFVEQLGHDTGDGRRIPDLIISLPNGQKLIVDAKAVMDACVEAYQAKNEDQRNIKLKQHCTNVRARVADLASKDYFLAHQDAVEMVVLFLPAENLYSAAVENDPTLTEDALKQKIIVCGPNSLMMLLKVANQLWRRASIEKEADDIKKCGDAIYKAACDFVDKFAAVGKKIQSLETEYNNAVGTFEGRLLPAGKRMNTFASVTRNKEIGDLESVKDNVREFKAATLHLASAPPELPGLLIGERENLELTLASGEK